MTTAHGTEIFIETPDGTASGVFFTPAGPGRWPGVVFLSDISGVRPAVTERAGRLASLGYAVLVPNVFHRSGQPPFFTFPIDFNDAPTRERFTVMTGALTPDAVARDARAYLDFLHRHAVVQPGPAALVGHCFTGAIALRMAASEGEAVRFAASFHGGSLHTGTATSPHLVLPQVSAELYFAHAVEDRSMPADAIAALEQALAEWGGIYESETYSGARHGWTMPDHPAYDADQSGRAFDRLREKLAAVFPKAV